MRLFWYKVIEVIILVKLMGFGFRVTFISWLNLLMYREILCITVCAGVLASTIFRLNAFAEVSFIHWVSCSY